VRFSFLLHSDTTVYAWQDKTFTVFTDLASVFAGQTDSSGHGYFSGGVHVVLGELRVFVDVFFS